MLRFESRTRSVGWGLALLLGSSQAAAQAEEANPSASSGDAASGASPTEEPPAEASFPEATAEEETPEASANDQDNAPGSQGDSGQPDPDEATAEPEIVAPGQPLVASLPASKEAVAPSEPQAPAADPVGDETKQASAADGANTEYEDEGEIPQPGSSRAGADGVRFRFGVQSGHGAVFSEDNAYFLSATELRFGAQVNDDLGIFLMPRFGIYSGGSSDWGTGGQAGIMLGADWTFHDRFFVGAGLGAAWLNNPLFFDAAIRVGAYPGSWRNPDSLGRKGFVVSLDLHHYRANFYRVYSPVLSLGYEAF